MLVDSTSGAPLAFILNRYQQAVGVSTCSSEVHAEQAGGRLGRPVVDVVFRQRYIDRMIGVVQDILPYAICMINLGCTSQVPEVSKVVNVSCRSAHGEFIIANKPGQSKERRRNTWLKSLYIW